MDLLSLLGAALGIGFLIFIHELGHFLAARVAGVRVEVFSIGFGQRVFGFQRNGTDYRLSAFPLGGYVRVAGEDPLQREGLADDDLYAQGFGARALFFSGGVLMNILFALAAFPLVFHSGIDFQAPVIGSVTPGEGAWQVGLQRGDRIAEVDGKAMYSFQNMEVELALAGGRRPVPLAFERDGVRREVEVPLTYSDSRGIYTLGVRPGGADEPLLIEAVTAGSPAAAAGLRAGDRIVAVNGEAVLGDDAVAQLASTEVGQTVQLGILRGDAQVDVELPAGSTTAPTPRVGVRLAQRRIRALRGEAIGLGLMPGDTITSIGGRAFYGPDPTEGIDPDIEAVSIVAVRDAEAFEVTMPTAQLADIACAEDPSQVLVVPQPNSPAEAVGLRPGDRVLRIDGDEIGTWEDLVGAVRAAGDSALEFICERDGQTVTLRITPTRETVADLGFSFSLSERLEEYRVDGVFAAIGAGFVASGDLVKQLYVTLKRLVTGDVSARNLGGIVTISRVSYRAVQNGLSFFLYFLALLSINLAFVNVLPIPVLDGGHLLFLLIERIKGSPVSARVLNYSQILGLVFVLALMVFVTYNDILRLL
jgi:regulator of sigma E protease